MTYEEARAQFPVLERLAYLNAGTNGPLAQATVDAFVAQAERDLREGRFGPAAIWARAIGIAIAPNHSSAAATIASVAEFQFNPDLIPCLPKIACEP